CLVDVWSVGVMHHFFFFSSRRRHTRCYRDWSSDVCSSDLLRVEPIVQADDWLYPECLERMVAVGELDPGVVIVGSYYLSGNSVRSEERRVGKEGRSRRCVGD